MLASLKWVWCLILQLIITYSWATLGIPDRWRPFLGFLEGHKSRHQPLKGLLIRRAMWITAGLAVVPRNTSTPI